MNALELGFIEHQATPDYKFPDYFDKDDKPMHIGPICNQIFKQIELYSGQNSLKHLAEFAKFLLLIPHSNSYCKSIFITTREICNDGHHNLEKDATEVHGSTIVYTETTSIRNNVLGILIPKKTTFGKKKLGCYEWEPTNSIFVQSKSTTYKKLQARKKKQKTSSSY